VELAGTGSAKLKVEDRATDGSGSRSLTAISAASNRERLFVFPLSLRFHVTTNQGIFMTQRDLEIRIARATGEDLRSIRERGVGLHKPGREPADRELEERSSMTHNLDCPASTDQWLDLAVAGCPGRFRFNGSNSDILEYYLFHLFHGLDYEF
jgi:hypothetical protein